MRLPWVSRDAHDLLKLWNDHLVAELAKEQYVSRSLLDAVLHPVQPADTAPIPQPMAVAPRDAISLAIDENKHAKRSAPLRAYLTRRAASQLDAGVSPERVLQEMQGWSGIRATDADDDDVIAFGVG